MKFYALKYKELILTVDPKTFTVESGARVMKGMLGLYPQGLSVNFKNREFDTKSLRLAKKMELRLIRLLKNHTSYGTSFVAEDNNKEEMDKLPQVQQENADKQVAKATAADTDHKKAVNK